MSRSLVVLGILSLVLQLGSAFVPSWFATRAFSASGFLHARKSPKDTVAITTSESSSESPVVLAKREALHGVISTIERVYGKGSIQTLGQSTGMNIETTSTGALTLDMALGGGYPKGRVIEIYGPESSGKTTLALHAVAEVQKAGGFAAFIDAEHALDPEYAKNLGVNVAALLVTQPDSGEMALDVADQLVRSNAVDLIVIDSVAALVPRAELEGDMGDSQIGLQARLMSKALRKLTGSLAKSQSSVIFINQLRNKINVMYGSPETTSGGNALKFYSSVRLDIRKKEVLKDNTGILARVKVVKNKIAPPFRVVELDILFNSGIDTLGCLLDAAESSAVVERRGSWYSKGELRFAQGRRAGADYLRSHPAFAETLRNEVQQVLKQNKQLMSNPDGPQGESRGTLMFGEGEQEDDALDAVSNSRFVEEAA